MKKSNKLFLNTKDFSVTGESYKLYYNLESDMLVTTPQPKADRLLSYYKSKQYISHVTQKRNLFDWIYFIVRNYTLSYKIKLLSKLPVKDKTLLDFGTGVGFFVRAAIKSGWKSIGIEASEDARKAANSILPNSIFDNDYIDQLEPKTLSIISLWHVLEHLQNPELYIRKFKQLLNEDGRLIVAVPNYKSYDAQYYREYWAAYDVPRHLWHFSQDSISRFFSDFGFQLEATHPMRFDAYYVGLLSTKYKYGKMKPLSALWIGFVSNFKAKRTGEYSSLIYVLKHKES